MNWTLAQRAQKMNPSIVREMLKISQLPGVISFAGGWPSATTFPVEQLAEACSKVLADAGASSLQYSASEGFGPLREFVASRLPWKVDPSQVLITTGSQQALDLLAKVLIDPGSKVLVETPTYLGALQSFAPMEPEILGVRSDSQGVDIEDMSRKGADGRFFYVLPNFQNPTGRSLPEANRAALSKRAARIGLPLVEDDPYGEIWFDQAPPAPLTARDPEACVYLGSFSKILSPGLRVGYAVVPKALFPKLLQAKQSADLHTANFNQRIIYEVLKNGFLESHIPAIRALYVAQRDAMLAALTREMRGLDVQWNTPQGGMFLWATLPAGLNAMQLLPKAVANGVAFVAGEPFFASEPDTRTIRLSFVTASRAQIDEGIAALAKSIRDVLHQPGHALP